MRVPLTQSLAKTGSVPIAGALALLEPMVNTVAYLLHERAWARFTPGRPAPASTVPRRTAERSC